MTLDAAFGSTAESERDGRGLQPVDALLSTFTSVYLDEDATQHFLHSQRLKLSELSLSSEAANAQRGESTPRKGRLLGVAKQGEGVLAPERLVVTTAGRSRHANQRVRSAFRQATQSS